MITYHPSYCPPVKPKRVKFSILSPEEIRKMSVVSIKESTIYYRGLPNSGGINDALMGTVDRRLLCGTCMKDVKLCQGHIGHIELPYPMYHISFFDTVLKILRITCFSCARCVNTDDTNHGNLNAEERKNLFNTVYNNSKTKKKCPHCGMVIPNYTRQTLSIKIDWPSDTVWESPEEKQYCNLPFTAREALSILTHVPDEDYRAMGFDPDISHPKNMILTVIVVPPPITRPAIMQSEGSRSRGQNDLTLKLQDISKKCIDLRSIISDWKTEKITSDLQEKLNKLQLEVFTVVNNSVRGQKQSTQRSGAPIKAIVDRIKGKDGRIRGNLMGKRVDFSSRSVISPCPYMDIDCVGVPEKIAMQLTVPERVTKYNIESLSKRVKNGSKNINGAETVITKENAVIQLQYCKNLDEIVLKPGDIVERFLKDNDTVVFNRQPSLHKMGMMAHRVRIVKGLTFRLNLVCTGSYNADFDGDEMNLHVPQSSAAIADAAMLMTVTQQIISPQSNKPVIGIVQDSLLGGHLLSQDDVLLNHKHACQICGSLKHTPKKIGKPSVIVNGKKYWTGKQLISIILPDSLIIDNSGIKDINYDDKYDVVIRNGKLHYGILTKKMLGTAAGGIIDVCCREFGNNVASKFMSDEQRMTNSFLLLKGFSVGISDCILSQEGHQRVNERLEKATNLCEEIMREVNRKDTPSEVKQNAESTIMRILSKTLMQTGSIVNECMSENAIKSMVTCMSKGTPINLSQICGTVGQQSVEGSRIHAEKGSRTLSCFRPNENTLTSTGFVHNSYALGLTPSEFFYHAMGGREGLVDTAVKTSVTGYIQRRQIKSMEDNKVAYDGTVRDSMDGVVDFFWGGDGLDSSKLERVKLNVFTEKVDSIRKRLNDVEFNTFMNARNNLLSTRLLPIMPSLDSRVLLPFNPKRLKQRLVYTEDESEQIGEKVASDELIKLIFVCNTNTLRIAVVDSFNSKAMAKVQKDSFKTLFETINKRIENAQINAGEMVGSIAAQSVGEPATQMTLNTFHSAGIGFKNVTLGIPRLKELLDVSKNSKTPSTIIRFKKPFSKSEEFVTYFANTLPLIRLGDLISNTEILYDPEFYKTVIKDDEWMVESTNILCGENVDENSSSYIVRLTLNQTIMKTRFLTPPIIRDLLKQRLGSRAQILSSEINCIDWVVRIRFARVAEMMKAVSMTSDREIVLCHRVTSSLIETMAISGHPKVQTASCMESEYQYIDSKGDVITEKEYIINTLGCCLSDICSSPCVDWYRTTSNDITEIIKIKGLEATCAQLYEQLNTVVSFDGTYIDPRHLTMLVNTMCRSGQIMALNRHGINRNYSGPLGKCSFEETPDVLCEAAVFGEIDNANGVSSSIMTGQLANIGTGTCDVLFNSENVNFRDVEVKVKPRQKKILKSTVRSHTDVYPIENIEYVYDDRKEPVISNTVQTPFEECMECDETDMLPFTNSNEEPCSPMRKRVKFRPDSPV